MHRNYDYVVKIVMIGSTAVGKSAILKRFADDQFNQFYISTIGVDFRFKSLNIDGNYVKLQIWDTAGQQRFKGITKSYYNNADAVIIVFDINDLASFQDIRSWLQQIKTYCSSSVKIFVIANKCDLGGNLKQTQRSYLDSQKLKYFMTSAKTGKGVHQSIITVAKSVLAKLPKNNQSTTNLTLRQTHYEGQGAQQKKRCCQ